MIETEPDVKDSPEVVKVYGDVFRQKGELASHKGNVTFDNVSFSYKDGEEVLENFSLDVKAGESIALVGETGSERVL